jgi:predicted O-methyltransferase YrrM
MMTFTRILNKLNLCSKDQPIQIERCLDIVMSIEGQISRAEAKTLLELAQNTIADSVIIEIGSYRGRSSVALAFGALLGNHNRVYAIDPHVEFRGIFGGQFGPRDQAELYSNLVKAGVGDIVAVVSLPSLVVAKGWHQRNVGLLWIDGDHNYEAVRTDYEVWRDFLIEDSVIALHDNQAPGVEQLIQELMQEGVCIPIVELGVLSCFRWKGKLNV